MRKKINFKILLQYKKVLKYYKISTVDLESRVNASKPIKTGKVGIRYNTATEELLIGGNIGLQVEMSSILKTVFQCEPLEIYRYKNSMQGGRYGKVRVKAKISFTKWKKAKKTIISWKVHGHKLWTVIMNANLSNALY